MKFLIIPRFLLKPYDLGGCFLVSDFFCRRRLYFEKTAKFACLKSLTLQWRFNNIVAAMRTTGRQLLSFYDESLS